MLGFGSPGGRFQFTLDNCVFHPPSYDWGLDSLHSSCCLRLMLGLSFCFCISYGARLLMFRKYYFFFRRPSVASLFLSHVILFLLHLSFLSFYNFLSLPSPLYPSTSLSLDWFAFLRHRARRERSHDVVCDAALRPYPRPVHFNHPRPSCHAPQVLARRLRKMSEALVRAAERSAGEWHRRRREIIREAANQGDKVEFMWTRKHWRLCNSRLFFEKGGKSNVQEGMHVVV